MSAPIQTVDADFARAVNERGDRLDMGLIERAFQMSPQDFDAVGGVFHGRHSHSGLAPF